MLLLTQNHFEFFQLPENFRLDTRVLNRAYRAVQAQVHPDRFASASSAQRQIAMQWATHANKAYQILKSPLQRATYLLHLRGIDLSENNNTAIKPAFLMQQMEWRERTKDAATVCNLNELHVLRCELQDEESARLIQLSELLDASLDQQAAEAVRQLMFIERVAHEIDIQIDKLEGA
ncbi:Fe-S protein assembly co-chaperone HscB [Candidatus Vallotia cooleyia]|uniref:Fe-S protein assembly co-chaperone HscB n=1 Tax=Candidatus Vallotiella adelgis TaxID=1177211 RepID=UPI001D00F669|nr:Fe-S protein assembly co-chaperone HscB [Candidatus Vallotia cooleyia]UDG82328.1 Co-chaperone protein HscB [Candidatus Vallotia cooleyia]